jgi:1,3-beta-glucan synthase
LGPRLLQDVLRKTVVRSPLREFQSYFRYPHCHVLFLHGIQLAQRLQNARPQFSRNDLVCHCTGRSRRHYHHDHRFIATLFEFSYIPTTQWNNTSHLMRCLIFLLVTLAITCGPTFYIAIVDSHGTGGSLSLILGIVQCFISAIAMLLFSIMPSGRMFGDRVRGKLRNYLASQTFTASYPALDRWNRVGSVLLWLIVFGCKFTESYFYLTRSFSYLIQVMVGMKIQGCTDRFFGNALCRNQAAFTLAIMYIMDLTLFFLDTFLWYIIWNTVFSIVRSFFLGLSVWTPWKDIFTRLPKKDLWEVVGNPRHAGQV